MAMTIASSSSVQSLGKITVLPASMSTKDKQLSTPQSSLSIPTKDVVHTAKDKTPTSKLVPLAIEVEVKDTMPMITSSIDVDKIIIPTSEQKDNYVMLTKLPKSACPFLQQGLCYWKRKRHQHQWHRVSAFEDPWPQKASC
ncbi:hypothetical protein GUJ93_ZPchr0001g29660 [Zizania palustris]|uniref:Uncharacterized protein n=1 Tax=Zizania palustris TaxID=103762 RepID=A0A8J5SBT0_ZIZPA|nr:hypothetical protein GUJ93_ZPchr0001g29660 [Zizania palustris]